MASESDTEMNGVNGTAGTASARTDAVTSAAAADAQIAQPSRRRAMLRTLGAAGPVVLTLASNPVSACTCIVASSYVSALALASRKPASATPCSGATPSRWAASGSSWPSPYVGAKVSRTSTLTTFKSVFGTTTGTSLTATSTLMDALGSVSGNYGTLANYCVAALLNAQSYKVASTVLSVAQIVQLWKDTTANGYFQPSASSSVKFTPAQTVTWLAEMMA